MIEPRCYVTALSLKGVVYALGGFDGRERLESCEKFDPLSTQWTHIADMNVRRSDASGALHKAKVNPMGLSDNVDIELPTNRLSL
ncbi:hypothetical protein CEXT_569881 [Caerostris extrusa]|uniref:Uncharacterized protein n=1 Tax=Caerostris extrusa TaxID=172846 RepID=A0AAV4VVJ8_CAEEX|nr:hypothetical protein CEXT_569881 [Caerostris extrusa]